VSEARLSPLQLAVLRVLWDRGEATVQDVRDGLAPEREFAQTTVATLLRRLEKRGVLTHRSEGRQFVYRPLQDADTVGRALVGELVDDLYGGRADALFAHLLEAKDVAPGDLARIKALIEEHQREEPRGRRRSG